MHGTRMATIIIMSAVLKKKKKNYLKEITQMILILSKFVSVPKNKTFILFFV